MTAGAPTPEPNGSPSESDEPPSFIGRARRVLFGKPRDLADSSLFHDVSLIPFLAWVGLGADGLSSSAYGPPDAYLALGSHTYLAVGLAMATMFTVLVISAGYSRIIEQFPHGGGGYLVATKLLGSGAGVVSGCALLVDYVLTITTSLAAAGDALFSLLPIHLQPFKLAFELVLVGMLTTLNIRGVREAVMPLVPVFLLFVATHLLLIVGGIVTHLWDVGPVVHSVRGGFHSGLATLGVGGMLALFARAYSLGGGTYTGIEAVSNGLPIMREPRVRTAKRTMVYMAISLALTAAGLLVCYLLVGVTDTPGKTLNAVLTERLVSHLPGATAIIIATLVSEGALLVVAAQAGFIDGPRVLANMALDGWAPRRFSMLSDRLTSQNGIALMGGASILALLYTRGEVTHLVVMYSINVFLTFSLSMLGMLRSSIRDRATHPHWIRRTMLFVVGFVLCATILVVTSIEKFREGGWLTLVVTAAFVGVCVLTRSHYRDVAGKLRQLDSELADFPEVPHDIPPLDATKPTAVILVGGYNGLGVHTVLNLFRSFKHHYRNLVFISAGVIDSGAFKGAHEMESLRKSTEASLDKYVELSRKLGVPAAWRAAVGTDPVDELEKLCVDIAREYPDVTYVAGQIIFQREKWWQGLLHNQTAYALQKRLQWAGRTMVILPVRLR